VSADAAPALPVQGVSIGGAPVGGASVEGAPGRADGRPDPAAARLDTVPVRTAPVAAAFVAPAAGYAAPVAPALKEAATAQGALAEISDIGLRGELRGDTPVAQSRGPGLAAAPMMPPPDQLVARIASAPVASVGEQVTIRLDPPELGHVKIAISGSEASITALVTAERGDVDQMLRRHADQLLQALRDAGYREVSLAFSNGGTGPNGQAASQERPEGGSDEREIEVMARAPDPARPAATLSGRMDLRF